MRITISCFCQEESSDHGFNSTLKASSFGESYLNIYKSYLGRTSSQYKTLTHFLTLRNEYLGCEVCETRHL